ncbi:hypothetical protein GQX74_013688 [Glossina fuscipes]|nr:hypothetical protein GQX74_013688 [Glossina fuscipes]
MVKSTLSFFLYQNSRSNNRDKCFTNETFGDCLKVLLIPEEEITQLKYFLKVVNGSPVPFDFSQLI